MTLKHELLIIAGILAAYAVLGALAEALSTLIERAL